MKQRKLVIFDWDGTLMDSIEHIVDSLQYAMQCMQIEVRDRDTARNIIGLGMRESVEALYPDYADQPGFIQRFVDCYREAYLDPRQQTPLFPGVEQTLAELKQQGYRLAVATSKSRRGLDRALQETALSEYFCASRCADETRSKPHPDMLHAILQDLRLSAAEAVMVGDTEYDMEMARQAGMDSVAVTYGVHDRQRLAKYSPLACIDSLRELASHVGPYRGRQVC